MKNELGKKLKKLLNDVDAIELIDSKHHYVYFDRLWRKPEQLSQCSDIVLEYVHYINKGEKILPDDRKNLVVLVPDSAGGKVGILPVGFFLARSLGCSTSIWKELAHLDTGLSEIYGNPSPGKTCILLQDVIDQGTTLLKVAHNLKILNWRPILYLCIIENSSVGIKGIEKNIQSARDILGFDIRFHFIVSIRNLT